MSELYVKCSYCGNDCLKPTKYINENKKLQQNNYCSRSCVNLAKIQAKLHKCAACGKDVKVTPSAFKRSKTKRFFCNSSCAAKYNNQHKTTGTRRSKLESYIETRLGEDFPSLKFLFNTKHTIGAELDILCEELNLAIEVNGIVHYEPLYGKDRLQQIILRDKQKMILCAEQGIELIVVNAASHRYVNKHTCEVFYKQVQQIISDILTLRKEL